MHLITRGYMPVETLTTEFAQVRYNFMLQSLQ